MTQETKAKDCCYGVRQLSDCQCEKDRLAALAAMPAGRDLDIPPEQNRTDEQRADIERAWQIINLVSDGHLLNSTEGHLAVLRGIQLGRLAAAAPAVGGEPLAWLYEMAFKIKPSDEQPFTKWKQVVTIDPPPTIPKDGVRNVVPLYAAPPASPLRGRERIAMIRRYVKNARGAIESGQVTDKDVHGTLTKVIAMLDAFSASPPEQPAAAGKLACRRCGGWGVIRMGGGERETCNLCHGTTIDPDQSPAAELGTGRDHAS